MKDKFKLDPGFEDQPLDEGFQEVPLNETPSLQDKAQNALATVKQEGGDLSKYAKETASDALSGGVQGATFNLADELEGGVKAAAQSGASFLKGEKGKKFLELYRENQKAAEKRYKAAQERSPYAYGAGELGGAIGTGLASAGSGIALGAGKLGLRAALQQGGIKALAEELGRRTGAAGVAGGLQGFGSSEGNLGSEEGRNKLSSDVLGGATLGATLGLGGSLLSKGGEAAGKKAQELAETGKAFTEDSPLFRQLGKSYKRGLAGRSYGEGEKSLTQVAEEQLKHQRGLTSKFTNAEDILGQDIGDLIDTASKAGAKINVDEPLKEATESLRETLVNNQNFVGRTEAKQLEASLARLGDSNLNPREAFNLRKDVVNLADKIDLPELKAIANRFQSGIKNALDQTIPGLKDASRKFYEFRKAGSETLLSKGLPAEYADQYIGKLKKPEQKISQAITEVLQSLTTPGIGKNESRRTYKQLVDSLEKYEQTNPGSMQRLGLGSIDQFKKDIIGAADDFALSRQILGYDPQSSPLSSLKKSVIGGATTGRGMLLGTANVAGKTARALSSTKMPTLGNKLYSAPDEALHSFADTLENSGLTGLATGLRRGLDEKNTSLKNAALFTIMQNPAARQLLNGDDENNDDLNGEHTTDGGGSGGNNFQ